MLLDEPLASLDVHLQAAMESEFVQFHQKTRTTMIYITHDQSEAMALADRIAVMDAGRLVQVARPEMLYREPATDIEVTTDGPVQETLLLSHADAPEIGARVHIGVRDGWVVPES